jgi:hypothetical protein
MKFIQQASEQRCGWVCGNAGQGRGGATDDKGAEFGRTDDHSALANDKGSHKRHIPMLRVRSTKGQPMKKVPYL